MERLRYLTTWLIRAILFVVILLFAMKNATPVQLHLFFGTTWQAPLALVFFFALASGAVLGLLAGLERILAQRRELAALKRELELRANESVAAPLAASAADFEASTVEQQ